MKRIILFFLVSIFVAGTANAQFRWGVKAGGNLSGFTTYKRTNYNIESNSMRMGFHVGGMAEYSFGKLFALQAEPQFMLNGGKTEEMQKGKPEKTVLKYTVNKTQLQMPVNMKFKFGTDSLRFYAMAGPYVGWGLSAKQKSDASGIKDVDLYDKKHYERFDWGINAGVGVEIKKITIGVSYMLTLRGDMDKRKEYEAKLGTGLLSVGYFF